MIVVLSGIIVLLVAALAAVIFIWLQTNEQLKRYDKIDDVESYQRKCLNEAERLKGEIKSTSDKIATSKEQLGKLTHQLKEKMAITGMVDPVIEARAELERLKVEIGEKLDVYHLQEVGFYRREFDPEQPDSVKRKLENVRSEQKAMMREGSACQCSTTWEVGGDAKAGAKMVKEQVTLMLRAFNGEADAAIAKVKHSNLDATRKRIVRAFDTLNKLGATKQISISPRYRDLKLDEVMLDYGWALAKEEERERQREIRERMREEERAEREIEQARKKAEKEEREKAKALEDAKKQLAAEHGAENARLSALIEKLEGELQLAIQNKATAISRAQMTRSGHVYVLSNIGTMGEGVFKIGMTRRLEPLDRVNELGDASVPFPFDVHAMIFTADAPGLEKKLHQHFNDKRVNLVNLRREYFRVSLDEIRAAVTGIHGDANFIQEAEAAQFKESESLRAAGRPVGIS